MEPISAEAQRLIESLEPDGVIGYTVAVGHAFDGIECKGMFATFEEALVYAENHVDIDDWHIVTLWRV